MVRVFFLLLFTLLLQGCASSRGELIEIEVDRMVARQNMVEELTIMLRQLGYDWMPILDPINRREVKVVEQQDEYRNEEYMMRFEYLNTRQVRIDVHIRWEDGFTRLQFYEPASRTLSASSRELLQQLRQRAAREFGEMNVTD